MAGLQVVSSAPKGSLDGSIYWTGTNGHVYIKGAGGNGAAVQDLGPVAQAQPWNLILNGAVEIADPNPGGGQPQGGGGNTAPSNPNGVASTPKVDKSNDIALQNAGLGAVDTQYNTGIAGIDKALAQLIGQYDTEAKSNETNYSGQSDTNQNNLQKNKQTALVNAAQGRQGLFGTLASLGALNGSGIDLANRAVQKGANDDLSGASDNYATNQSGLDTAIGQFRQEDKMRRENASTSAENAKTNAANEAAKSRMSFYSNLANDYAAMGDTANASKFTGLASSLYPELAKTSVPNANIAYSGAAFTPGTLADYMAGANSTVVSATPTQPGQNIPGLVATPTQRKKQLATV